MAGAQGVRSGLLLHSGRWWPSVALVVCGVVAAGLVASPAAASPAVAAVQASSPQAMLPVSGVESALAAAAGSGQPVEVFSQRSDRARVWANPSGTMTAESSVLPRWTRRADGSWVDIDTRLRRAGGGLVPAATLADVRFSTGGAGPFVALRRDGHTFTLSWPGELPTPTLAGDAVTYAEVLPAVDLVVRATAAGFSHVLVVKTAAAAADPRVRQVRLDIGGDVSMSTTAEGGLRVTAGTTVVATAGGASMWDSTTPATAASSRDEPAPPASSPAAPAETARVGEVDLAVAGGDLILTPDPALLTGGSFPVFVDPDFSTDEQWFAYANSTNTNHWPYPDPRPRPGTTGELGGYQLRAGLNPTSGSGGIFRGFVQFPMIRNYDLRSKHILSAKLHGWIDHTWKCGGDREVLFYRSATIAATPRQAWPGPALQVGLGSVYARANEESCSEGNRQFEVGLTGDLQTASTGNWGTYTVAVVAQNEGQQEYWFRMFLDSFFLTATFNTAPATPTALAAENTGCGPSAVFVSSATPALRAHIFDPDGDTDLTAQYAWDRFNTTTSGWDRIGDFYKTGQTSNTDPVLRPGVDTGAALQHGRRYRFTVAVLDPWTFGGASGTDYSAWAPWCEFEVDTQNPAVVPIVSSTVYPEYIPGVDEDYHGGVGHTGAFTFTANETEPDDVSGFKWGWSDPPTSYVPAQTLGGQAAVELTPPPPFPAFPTRKGQLNLHVRSVDRAGREGPVRTYPIRVAKAADPAGVWQLDDPAGATTLADTTVNGTPHPATPTNVTTGAAGRLLSGPAQTAPTVASFNGTTSFAATGTAALNTSQSYTVSAWVQKGASPGRWVTAVSDVGVRRFGFSLQYDPSLDRWRFVATETDSDNNDWTWVASQRAPMVGVWTHLVGVYDSGADRIELYVDGVSQGTASLVSRWSTSGPVQIGREKWVGGLGNYWPGAIAEVKVWQRVVSEFEARTMAATQVGAWRLDGDGGDDSVWGRSLAPTAGVSWGPGKIGDATVLNGTSAELATAGPAMRTDQSFTVTAWVKADVNNNGWRSIVSAAGSYHSAFMLRRSDGNNLWILTLVPADSGTAHINVVGTVASPATQWVHVAGVYDAQARQARLYVQGVLQATATVAGVFAAAGPLVVGHDRWAGNPTFHSPWQGAVDDVRIYAGALPDNAIKDLFQP